MFQEPLRFLVIVVALAPCTLRAADDAPASVDSWDAVFIGKDKVGYEHAVIRPLKEKGADLVQMRVESVMTITRFGQTTELKLDHHSVETPDGKLLRIDNRSLDSVTRGVVQRNELKLTLLTPGKESKLTVPWSDDVLGPAAESRFIQANPLKPGAKRSFRSFMPDLNRVITNSYYGDETEDVKLLDGSARKLQRIRAEIDGIPELKNLKRTLWVDERGDTIKWSSTVIGITAYRTTKDVALAPPRELSEDFGLNTLVKIDKPIPNPFDATEIVYRVQVKDDSPADVFPQDDRQSLAKNDDGEWLLTIRSIDPTQPAPAAARPDLAEFLRPNNWLQSDNPKVIAAAKQATAGVTDPWDKARRIERWVFENIKQKNFSKAFDSAAVVAEKLEGDCTEHGVLVAAMARVAEVPARVATGLVYAQRLGAFGFHMWAEVYVNGRWVPLDGTLGRGHASPVHIKLGDSSLDGVDATAIFLSVIRAMGGLKLEVVSWKHADVK